MPAKLTSSFLETDVLVIGGGPSGLASAIAASRYGVKVILVEKEGFLGGNLTMPGMALLGFFDQEGNRIIGGIAEEFVKRMKKAKACIGHRLCPKHMSVATVDPEMVKFVALNLVYESNVKLLFHSFFRMARKQGDEVTEAIFSTKSGDISIRAKLYIDCSGDGDLAAKVGEEYELDMPQPPTLTFRMANVNLQRFVKFLKEHPEEINPIRDGRSERKFPVEFFQENTPFAFTGLGHSLAKAHSNGMPLQSKYLIILPLPRKGQMAVSAAKVLRIDGTNVMDLTKAEILGRRQIIPLVKFLNKYIPGFKEAYLIDTAHQIGLRETRRLVGAYILTAEDVLSGTKFSDAVGKGIFPLDIHRQDGQPSDFTLLKKPYYFPYRCLLPVKSTNLILAGRCISCDKIAFGSIRVTSHCMVTGEAAGTAAAIAVKSNQRPSELCIDALQKRLQHQGVIL